MMKNTTKVAYHYYYYHYHHPHYQYHHLIILTILIDTTKVARSARWRKDPALRLTIHCHRSCSRKNLIHVRSSSSVIIAQVGSKEMWFLMKKIRNFPTPSSGLPCLPKSDKHQLSIMSLMWGEITYLFRYLTLHCDPRLMWKKEEVFSRSWFANRQRSLDCQVASKNMAFCGIVHLTSGRSLSFLLLCSNYNQFTFQWVKLWNCKWPRSSEPWQWL